MGGAEFEQPPPTSASARTNQHATERYDLDIDGLTTP
jgi:hypothetical protein